MVSLLIQNKIYFSLKKFFSFNLDDEEGNIYEGFYSNFFIIRKDPLALLGAPKSKVLGGVTAKLTIEICNDLDLQVIHQFPNLNQIDSWSGAFITSSFRGVMPINTIYLLDQQNQVEKTIHLHSDQSEQLKSIYNQFVKKIQISSTKII